MTDLPTSTRLLFDLRPRVLAGEAIPEAEFFKLIAAYRADRAAAVEAKTRKARAKQVDLGMVFGTPPIGGSGK